MVTDADLIDQVLRGHRDSFRALVLRYERSVLANVRARVPDAHAAEDITQATFLQAYRSLRSLRDRDRFGAWLMQIARRQIIDAARSRPVEAMKGGPPPTDMAAIPAEIDARIEREHLLSVVEQLPEQERLVVGLRYFDGHSTDEIAAMTNRPLGTVTKQLSRAITRMRALLKEEHHDGLGRRS